MKVLVTGAGGQLGYDVIEELNKRNIACQGADLAEFDIPAFNATVNFIINYMPDVVVHCSAYTAVDNAEDNQELCRRVNAIGTENIAKICKKTNVKMMYISTDYVFPGVGNEFYKENDATAPLNFYGLTKLEV